uniref:SCP domain-containing protein n=1 Tax=Strongyloides papillosus TaxID=174720 RepID=A0A0N5BVV5_STREA
LCAIVITHIAFGQVRKNSHNSGDDRNQLLDGEDSDRKYSGRKYSGRNNSFVRRASSQRRSSSSSRRSSTCSLYSGFDITPYLSRNKYSNYIYRGIWGGCDYKCFCQNNFKLFLTKVVFEINIMRQSHQVRCLKRAQDLDILAQHLANMMASKSKLISDPTTGYGVSVSVAYNPLSSLMVTEWYDQRRHYYYTFGHGSLSTSKFTQLVWKDTSFVGVGAATNGTHTFLAVYYYPRGNIRGKFRKNVFRQDTKLLKKII